MDTDEEEATVWKSYKDTTEKHNIHSIPYFVFNGLGSNGGPFRSVLFMSVVFVSVVRCLAGSARASWSDQSTGSASLSGCQSAHPFLQLARRYPSTSV